VSALGTPLGQKCALPHSGRQASAVSRLLIVTGRMRVSLAAGGGQRSAGLTDRRPGHVERCGGGSCRAISWRGRTGRPRAGRVRWPAAPMREGACVEAPDRVPAQPVHALEDQTGGQVRGRCVARHQARRRRAVESSGAASPQTSSRPRQPWCCSSSAHVIRGGR
jgi:hypothetical protein